MAGSAATGRRWLRPAVLDRIEQAIIVVLWAFFAWRMGEVRWRLIPGIY